MRLLTKIHMKVQIKPWILWHSLCAVCWLLCLSSLVSSIRLCSRSSSFHNVHHSSTRNLDFIFAEYLSFSDQISELSKSCYSLIRALRCMYRSLPRSQKNQVVPSPHPLSILNLTTATLFIIIFLTLNYTDSSRFSTLLPALFQYSKNLSHHSSPIASLHWLKIKERIEYKLSSLTYKILTTIQATYIHNLVSPQSPRGTRSSSIATFCRPESRYAQNLVNWFSGKLLTLLPRDVWF